MASYTPNLNLYKKDPIADGNDFFNIKTMMNDNWDKIDEKVKDALDDIGDLQSEQVRIATGSYVGTGTYGASNPCSLTFPFPPKFVCVTGSLTNVTGMPNSGPQINNEMFPEYADRLSTTFQIGCGLGENSYGNYTYGMRSADGKTWYWYNANSADSQNNDSEITYLWVAMG